MQDVTGLTNKLFKVCEPMEQKKVLVCERPRTWIEIDVDKDSEAAKKTFLIKHHQFSIRSHFIECPHCGFLTEIIFYDGYRITRKRGDEIIRDSSKEKNMTCLACDKRLIKSVRTKF